MQGKLDSVAIAWHLQKQYRDRVILRCSRRSIGRLNRDKRFETIELDYRGFLFSSREKWLFLCPVPNQSGKREHIIVY